jgi:hypothetical protein
MYDIHLFFICSIHIYKSTNDIRPQPTMITDTCVCPLTLYKLVTRSVCHHKLVQP